jgi:cell wall-associated NlpC family hydrolase
VVDAAGDRGWASAQDLIGVPFRLHGRDPASGLDCVGLIVAAYRQAGFPVNGVPERYRLCGPELAAARDWLRACGAMPVSDAVKAGDIALTDLGEGARRQLHLLLLGPGGAIHAHAGLRRVVWTPIVPGVLVGRWRVCP